MPINLEAHKIFIKDLNMEVVPYSVAMQAMQELSDSFDQYQGNKQNLEAEMQKITDAFKEINEALKEVGLPDFNHPHD